MEKNIVEKKKKTKGRRIIPMKLIENWNSRQVAFCKRRSGLFHKAAKLCQSTGAAVGIIVPSLGRPNYYTFGHPNIDSVINNYQNGGVESTPMNFHQFSGEEVQLMQRHGMLYKERKAERKKIKAINEGKKGDLWWHKAVEDLGVEELELYLAALNKLRKNALIRADELVAAAGTGSSSAVVDDFDSILADGYGDFFLDNAADQCLIRSGFSE